MRWILSFLASVALGAAAFFVLWIVLLFSNAFGGTQ